MSDKSIFKKIFQKKEKKEVLDYDFASADMKHLLKFKPAEKYVFRSDYYYVDSKVATIMTFVHKSGARDGFGAFWGVGLIPATLPEGCSAAVISQFKRYSEGWIKAHQGKAETVTNISTNEAGKSGGMSSQDKGIRALDDLREIASELNDGATYHNAQFRILVKAPNIDELDRIINALSSMYMDRFGTLDCAPYNGQQRRELTTLFSSNDVKAGKGFDFTSIELAGSYNLVTHGLEDPEGEYIGVMDGDINTSAVLFDIDSYTHHIVVANSNFEKSRPFKDKRVMTSALWASKISQSALLRGHRVAHLILDNTNLDYVGPKFDGITARLDLNKGEVNMFEVFGSVDEELELFAANIQKIGLMLEQASPTTDSDRSVIHNNLEKILTRFYVDKKLWVYNAANNRDKVKVVGLKHTSYPKLQTFIMSVLDERASQLQSSDQESIHAINVLKALFENMLNVNGDLFNEYTKNTVDNVPKAQRMVYDFSKLQTRGNGIAMAQLVNVISFVVSNLHESDVMIIHGADNIDAGVKDFLTKQIARLYQKGARVVFVYNNVEKMIKDKAFSEWHTADYTITGMFKGTEVQEYQDKLGKVLPDIMAKTLTTDDYSLDFIHRGIDNVIVRRDLRLGL